MQQLLHELEDIAGKIRALEASARAALTERDDEPTYRRNLGEKTSLLMELPQKMKPFLDCLEGPARKKIEAGLKDFARRASQAHSVESIFYMAGLLYPDDYREGDPNDLERFIENVRKEHLASV
jgi:hypothetical protein